MTAPTPADAGFNVYPGARAPNSHVFYGQDDQITTPVTYGRFLTHWNQLQLSNGWDNTNYGHRDTSPQAGYLFSVVPFQPGQTRLYGSNPADFPMQGPSYPQWQAYVQTTAGAQPQYVGGPGQILGGVFNPGSGA